MVRHSDFAYRRQNIQRRLRLRLAAALRRLHLGRSGSGHAPSSWDAFGAPTLRNKWVAVPRRCGDDAHWGVHDVYSVTKSGHKDDNADWKAYPRDIVYRHFRQLTVGPKAGRQRGRRYLPLRFVRDRPLLAAFAVAFPARHRRPDGEPGRRRT
jgi:hypothetical protein